MKKIPVEIYSRVVGYFRPLNQWNKGKQSEFKDRVTCDIKKSMEENNGENLESGKKKG